jgi:soluble lytic murein transglycosylase-like protein
MRLIALVSLLLCSALAEDQIRHLYQLPAPPVVTFPGIAKVPAVLDKLPRRIVDPTAMIHASARKHKVRPALVKSIVKAESAFNANAVSPRGALGLMQLMPATAQEYGASDPLIPEQNIDAGTQYLGWLIQKYSKQRNGLKKAIAAYNAGPGVVDRYRGIPPYKETRGYVTRVLSYLKQYEQGQG